MKYYKSEDGPVYAYASDGSQDAWIKPGLVPMTQQEVDDFMAAMAAQPPAVVSRAQGKAALIQAGLWDQVLAYVESIADPTEKALADVALNDTTEWRRDSAFLNAAAAAIGLTPAQLDGLFIAAGQIKI